MRGGRTAPRNATHLRRSAASADESSCTSRPSVPAQGAWCAARCALVAALGLCGRPVRAPPGCEEGEGERGGPMEDAGRTLMFCAMLCLER